MDINTIFGLLRTLIPAIAAYLAGAGVFPTQQTGVDVIAAIVALAAALWSWWSNRPAQLETQLKAFKRQRKG